MEEKTFTERLANFLLSGDIPSVQGRDAKESALIIATQKGTPAICASFGSSFDMALTITSVMNQNEPIRDVLLLAVGAYMANNRQDPHVVEILKYLQ